MRHNKYIDTAVKGIILPEKLPPTERAAYFHGLRAHLQIMQWSFIENEPSKQAMNWGWREQDGHLVPILTDIDIAPC